MSAPPPTPPPAPPSPPLSLEITEGPGAGLSVALPGPIVVGRGDEADLVLDDVHASRAHVRISPGPGEHAVVEDLRSSNGTFVNQVEVHGPTEISIGDELLVGVTVLALRARSASSRGATAVHPIPPALAVSRGAPAYVEQAASPGAPAASLGTPAASPGAQAASPGAQAASPGAQAASPGAPAAAPGELATRGGVPELERLLDANVRFRARTAPLAVIALVALIVAIYLGAR